MLSKKKKRIGNKMKLEDGNNKIVQQRNVIIGKLDFRE